MNSRLSSERIKAEAKALGFFACGVAKAGPVERSHAEAFSRWLSGKMYAGMAYMANNTDKRLDPRLLMPGVKSIISVALNYAPAASIPEGEPQIAAYALGQDYHDIIKSRLHTLAARLGVNNYRAFCDTAPVLERYWAVQAGLGWIGCNHQLIIPRAGSMFFLGELFIEAESEYDSPLSHGCGACGACIKACPTGALRHDGTFDAAHCLSYQTIENRGEIPEDIACKMGYTIYGCDRCLKVCPWNKYAIPNNDPQLIPKQELLHMTRDDWRHLTVEQYRMLFKGSAVKRAKYEGLKRNISIALQNMERGKTTTQGMPNG